MSFRLTSQFQIGNYQFSGGVQDCEIKRSVKEIVDTAILMLPALVSKNLDNLPANSVQTSTLFNEGDPVVIQLGYDYRNVQEFKGFVRKVSAGIPVKIECEGYAWQLRRKQLVGSWPSITLSGFLKLLTDGTNINLSPYIPDWILYNLKGNRPNCLKDLEYLRDQCHLSVYFLFDTLYAGTEEGVPTSTGIAPDTKPLPVFRIGWNTLRDDKLKWRKAAENPVTVRMVTSKGKNKQSPIYSSAPTSGSVITEDIANISDAPAVTQLVQDKLQQASYTGYEGSITGFLQPYIQMCDAANVQDPMYKVRQGSFFTQGTNVKFGVNGATREVFISRSLTATT